MKIVGYTVGTPLPKPNLKQTDPTKGDYIKGKEILDEKYIKVDEQELTEDQKAQARANVNAVSMEEASELTDGVAFIDVEDNENIEDTSTQLTTTDIVDSLDTTSTTRPLSANQGRVLNEKIESTQQRIDALEENAQPIEDDEFLNWLNETSVVEPVADESGAIYTTNNNEIYIL